MGRIGIGLAAAALACSIGTSNAEPVTVRHPTGTSQGFLLLQTMEGATIATGELTVAEHAKGTMQSRLVFTFKDGSVDEETTVYTQHGTFHLISDHHIQKGPFFPKGMDTLIQDDGTVIAKTYDKNGKESVTQDHVEIPSDLSNGLVSSIIDNLAPGTQQASVTMYLGSGKPTLATLQITNEGEEEYHVGTLVRRDRRYRIHIDLSGAKKILAPLVGKQPKDVYVWVTTGPAPMLIREEGQTFEDGPVLRMLLTSPRLETAGERK